MVQSGSMVDSPPSVPDFSLLRRIGRGSYGEVWLARSVTGIYRAVKSSIVPAATVKLLQPRAVAAG